MDIGEGSDEKKRREWILSGERGEARVGATRGQRGATTVLGLLSVADSGNGLLPKFISERSRSEKKG